MDKLAPATAALPYTCLFCHHDTARCRNNDISSTGQTQDRHGNMAFSPRSTHEPAQRSGRTGLLATHRSSEATHKSIEATLEAVGPT